MKFPFFKIGGSTRPTTGGFTLMEILLAISILGIILAAVLGTFTGIISSSRTVETRADLYQTGRAVMDLICADIRGMLQAPVREGEYFFVGDEEIIEGKPMSMMGFITTHSMAIGVRQNPFLSRVDYHVKRNPHDPTYSLWRRAQSLPEGLLAADGRGVPICRNLEKFRLEFEYNNDRRASLLNAIPQSILIDFTLNMDGERENFVTKVRPMVVGGL